MRYPEKEVCNALRLDEGLERFRFWEEGVDDEKDDGQTDAGIGHIEGRKWISLRNVEIEEKEINHIPMQQAISQVPQNSSKQKREREVPPKIGSVTPVL